MNNKENHDPLFSRKEAARYIGKAPVTLATWACTQRYNLEYLKIGRSVHYRKSALDKFLNESLVNPMAN